MMQCNNYGNVPEGGAQARGFHGATRVVCPCQEVACCVLAHMIPITCIRIDEPNVARIVCKGLCCKRTAAIGIAPAPVIVVWWQCTAVYHHIPSLCVASVSRCPTSVCLLDQLAAANVALLRTTRVSTRTN